MTESPPNTPCMPVIFAAHGAPILLDDAGWMAELAAWARALPPPAGVLMVSAHWERRPVTLGATGPAPLVYDFYGFPERFYQLTYPQPGAPALAGRVRALLAASAIPCAEAPARGLDHGAWVPLLAMYPQATVPVLQISMPALVPAELVALGRALAPLRDEGVLIFGSGFITHNMRYAFVPGTPDWARDFDAWVADALTRFDLADLEGFLSRGPGARQSLPTWEHYAPLLVSVGAAVGAGIVGAAAVAGIAGARPAVRFPITGWWMDGAFTRRSVQFD